MRLMESEASNAAGASLSASFSLAAKLCAWRFSGMRRIMEKRGDRVH